MIFERGRPDIPKRPFLHDAQRDEKCWCKGSGYATFTEVWIDMRTGVAVSGVQQIIELCPCQWRRVDSDRG